MNLQAISQLNEAQVQDLQRLYQSAWWSKERQLDEIRRMLAGSDIIVGECQVETGRLISFARVLTDFVYRALILDVIVDEAFRNQGLGRRLMEQIVHHPQLQSVEALLLFCEAEMVPFYRKWGFQDDLYTLKLMGRMQPKPDAARG